MFSGRNGGGILRGEGAITPRINTSFGNDFRNYRPRDSGASVDSGVSDTSSIHSRTSPSSYPSTPIGPIAGNKLRPLSLVQKNINNGIMSPTGSRRISGDYMDDDDKFNKRSSKRGSWYVPFDLVPRSFEDTNVPARMGWFNRENQGAPNGFMESVVFEGKDVE